MTSRHAVFLDADVLDASLTRTLIMTASTQEGSRFFPRWSLRVEAEADRHTKPEQTRLADVRERWWGADVLVPSGDDSHASELTDTDVKDRHVLLAAEGAGIHVVVSRNVRHFGMNDLVGHGLSVVHPDLFLAHMVSGNDYRTILSSICARRSRQPNTPAALHAAIGRDHPRLFAAMADQFPGTFPNSATHHAPKEEFRGNRCLVCGRTMTGSESLGRGVGPECWRG